MAFFLTCCLLTWLVWRVAVLVSVHISATRRSSLHHWPISTSAIEPLITFSRSALVNSRTKPASSLVISRDFRLFVHVSGPLEVKTRPRAVRHRPKNFSRRGSSNDDRAHAVSAWLQRSAPVVNLPHDGDSIERVVVHGKCYCSVIFLVPFDMSQQSSDS